MVWDLGVQPFLLHHFDYFVTTSVLMSLSSMADTIVLYPSPGIGHLISMVELGKLLLKHRPSFSITIFITTAPYTTGVTAPYINHVASTTSSITFHQLTTDELPPTYAAIPFEELFFEIPRLNNPYLHEALQNISQKSNILAFFIDFFCNAAFEVSSKLGIPTYYFYTSGVSGLCAFLYVPTLYETFTNFRDVHDYIKIPGTPPIYSQNLPKVLLDRESRLYKLFLETAIQMGKSSGIMVNSFEALELRAVKALSDDLCIPKAPTPPVYCIGPLIASKDKGSNNDEHECLSWLNLQPSKSVVFLCFGSMGSFTAEQLLEMAAGLENSGHRFLWVVRNPPTDDETKDNSAPAEPDLDALLPEGFLERTEDRGLVVKSWAPQLDVLNHDSVGGFVTHCGWNSALEAICAGVPMLAWPLYAEQRMNMVFMVEELKVALGLTESTNGFVTAAELDKRVRELMDSDNGKAVKDHVMAMRNCAEAAIQDGGSSHVALEKLIESWAKR